MFINAIKRGQRGLYMMVFMVSFGMIIFASIMFYVEGASCTFSEADDTWYYSDGSTSPYQSIPHTMWWAIVTMTTVGYGDEFPITGAGYAFGAITGLCGIVVCYLASSLWRASPVSLQLYSLFVSPCTLVAA
jgi:Ion transport protein